MSRAKKIWLIVAACLVISGLVVSASVMAVYDWEFSSLDTANHETSTHEITEDFRSISMHTDTADITFVRSTDSKCTVVCREETNAKHSVAVQNGHLVIELIDERNWYEHIGISAETPKITISLPGDSYDTLMIRESTGDIELQTGFQFGNIDISTSTGDVKNFADALDFMNIKTSTGTIRVETASADTLDLSTSTGNITVSGVTCGGDVAVHVSTGKTALSDVTCKNVISTGGTGDILLSNVIAKGRCSIERSAGDVEFDRSDANEIFIKTDSGDVEGTLLSDKIFIIETDTGDVDVPKMTTGGRCEITTDTGDVEITIK